MSLHVTHHKRPLRLVLALGLVAALSAGCTRTRAAAASPPPALPRPASAAPDLPAAPHVSATTGSEPQVDPHAIVAELEGKPITQEELDVRAGQRLIPIRQQEYDLRREALDELVAERLYEKEAARRGMTTQELLQAEVDGKAQAPGTKEIDAIYERNKPRLGGRTKEQVTPQIEQMLREKYVAERREAFRRELARKAGVRIHLAPPRFDVAFPAGAPTLGPPSAPVTILEFTDFQCPYCQRAQDVVEAVLKQYSGKVRLVHLDFPIEGHPRAFPASRAARCAGEQGKFWEYRTSLLRRPADFGDEDLRGRAAALGMNVGVFGTCLASDRQDAGIREASSGGSRAGVTSTPTFFVNGRMVVGARPIEQFQSVIDEELARGR